MTAAKNSALSWPYGWLASAGLAASERAAKATPAAATLTTVSAASENSAALPVTAHAAVLSASTTTPIAILPAAIRCACPTDAPLTIPCGV